MRQTPGKWSAQGPKTNNGFDNQTYFTINSNCGIVRGEGYLLPGFFYPLSSQSPEEMQANADFIAEAGTVANESGLSPSQLLAQRNELLKQLNRLNDFVAVMVPMELLRREDVKKAIAEVKVILQKANK